MEYTYEFLCKTFGWLARITDCLTFFNISGTEVSSLNPWLILVKTIILIPFLFVVYMSPIYWILKMWVWMLVEIANGFTRPYDEDTDGLIQKIIGIFTGSR